MQVCQKQKELGEKSNAVDRKLDVHGEGTEKV